MALSIMNDRAAIERLLSRQKLNTLRTATGENWQARFGLSDAIPATVLVEAGRVRVVHNSVMPDPAAELETDLAAVHGKQ